MSRGDSPTVVTVESLFAALGKDKQVVVHTTSYYVTIEMSAIFNQNKFARRPPVPPLGYLSILS